MQTAGFPEHVSVSVSRPYEWLSFKMTALSTPRDHWELHGKVTHRSRPSRRATASLSFWAAASWHLERWLLVQLSFSAMSAWVAWHRISGEGTELAGAHPRCHTEATVFCPCRLGHF